MSVYSEVKEKYPDANQLQIEWHWVIFSDYTETRSIGKGATSDEAWADAANRRNVDRTGLEIVRRKA